jgi:hypothetical protein
MQIRTGTGGNEVTALVNGFQVAVGLLLLSVSSATSLSEERVRGSLDVLLATPLATPSVLWGKWWGAYRGVLWMALLPGLTTCVGCVPDRWLGPPLVAGLVLAYGAAINSLGLALATWIRSVGRVLTLCVGAYVAVAIGWIALMMLIFPDGPGDFGLYAAMASPFFGVGVLSDVTVNPRGPDTMWPAVAIAAAFWIAVYGTATAVLLIATRDTFDRCLGRMSDRPSVPRRAPVDWKPKPKPVPAMLGE